MAAGPFLVPNQSAVHLAHAGATDTMTLPNPPTVGNVLLAFVSFFKGTIVVSPPDQNWTQIDQGGFSGDGIAVFRKVVALAPNEAAAPRAYTFTLAGTADQTSGILVEVAGADVSPVDQHGISAGETAVAHVGPSQTPSVLNCLVLACCAPDGKACNSSSLTAGFANVTNTRTGAQYHPLFLVQRSLLTSDVTTAIQVTITLTAEVGPDVNDGCVFQVIIKPPMYALTGEPTCGSSILTA